MSYEHNRAFVVAIEAYAEDAADWSLNGPVADAVRLVAWLVDGRVPPEHVHFFASAAHGSRSLEDLDQCVAKHGIPQWRRANRTEIGNFINQEMRAFRGGGDLFFMYWSGHGLMHYTGTERYLLLSDADSEATRIVNLDAFIDLLNTAHMPPFAHYALFVDACANYMGANQSPLAEPLKSADGRVAQDLFVYLAAGQGEVAKTDPEMRTGEFSRVLCAWLEQQGAGNAWLAARRALTDHVDQHFRELAKTSLHEQRPVSRWGTLDGHELKPLGALPGSAHLPAAARRAHLSVSSIRTLGRKLAELDLSLDAERWRKLPLPRPLQEALDATRTPRHDYEALVALAIDRGAFEALLDTLTTATRAAESPQVERLRQDWISLRRQSALADIVLKAAQPEIRAAFDDAVNHTERDPPGSADEALLRLDQLQIDGEPGPLHRFLARMEGCLDIRIADKHWRLPAADIAIVRAAVEAETRLSARPHLAVDLSRGTTPGAPWPRVVVAFLRDKQGQWSKYREMHCSGDADSVRETAAKIIDEYFEVGEASVGLLVRPEHLPYLPEHWPVDLSLGAGGLPLKSSHITLLHMADRAIPDHRMQKLWLKCVSDGPLNPSVTWHDEHVARNRARLKKHLLDNRKNAIGVLGIPIAGSIVNPNDDRLGFLMALNLGLPLLLWSDVEPPDWAELRAATEELLAGDLTRFPERLYGVRADRPAARQFIADHLRAIWDVPEYLPPAHPLPGMQE